MATNPPAPDGKRISHLLDIASKTLPAAQALADAINLKNGTGAAAFKELHTLVLKLKDATNDAYKDATAADRAVQTGKRKDKPPKDKLKSTDPDDNPEPKPKADKKPTRAEKKAANRAKAAEDRASKGKTKAAAAEAEPPMTGQGSDEP